MIYILIGLILLDFVLGRTLSVLNASYENRSVPECIRDIYSEEKREKQVRFSRVGRKFSWVLNSVETLAVLLMIILGGYRFIDEQIHGWCAGIENPVLNAIVMAACFFLIISLLSRLLNLPFDIYHTFGIMKDFGFNKTTPKTFTLDILKSVGLNIVITTLILAAVVSIYNQIPDWFWLLAWAVVSGFSLFMSYFYSQLIVPLFNKQTPLEDGELREAIKGLAEKSNFSLKDIYVMDSSKRSTIANAYFTGFGRRRRIVLYDTLIEQLTTEEITAVLAHEIGHWRHRHTLKSIVISLITSLLMFYLLGLTLKYNLCAEALGCVESFHVNMYFFYTLYTPIETLLSLAGNAMSRKHEYQADNYTKECGVADAQITALKKLSGNSLSNPTPHPAFVFFHYSHPTLVDRIENLRRIS